MSSELLQIEERQKLYSSSSNNLEQAPPSIDVEQSSQQAESSSPEAPVEVAEASTSSQTSAPSSSGRPLAAAWPSSPPSKRSARSGRGVVQPYSPPGASRPVAAPEAESKRDFHSDHSREGTTSQVPPPPQPEAHAAAPNAAEKPPPLAGPNVMNIVCVAAECAPWSKTGRTLRSKLKHQTIEVESPLHLIRHIQYDAFTAA